MKNKGNFWITAALLVTILAQESFGQQIDEERMKRDIAVAENVLTTLIKQEMDQQNTFFGLDARGSYQPGYGVTFRVPFQYMPFAFSVNGDHVRSATVIADGNGYRYSISTSGTSEGDTVEEKIDEAITLKDKAEERKKSSADSVRADFNNRLIRAAQNFILDYGEFISQLGPNEKIVVTNQGERAPFYFKAGNQTRISVEGARGDVTALRQGKISREQALRKLTVINTQSVDAREPDMEMLSSIFGRLYRPDLSKTYFVEGNVYYERLKDFGTIFYMQMVSSIEKNLNRFAIPTQGLDNLDRETRDKKVTELYPVFERDLKENILEYGRTIKSLKDDESLIFNISLTQCTGCGIPRTLELAIKSSVLKNFAAGKIDKSAAMTKFNVKKGANQ